MPSTTFFRQLTRNLHWYFPMARTSPSSAKYWNVEARRNSTQPLSTFGDAEFRSATPWAYMALCSTNSTTRSRTTQLEEMKKLAIQMAQICAHRGKAEVDSRK